PSAVNCREVAPPRCPLREVCSFRPATSHSLSVPSELVTVPWEPTARVLPSDVNARDRTWAVPTCRVARSLISAPAVGSPRTPPLPAINRAASQQLSQRLYQSPSPRFHPGQHVMVSLLNPCP